ncbi:MAG: hypothetical protein ACYCVH_08405, partial [Ignavibacteriaceae bacterium]
MVIKNKLGSIRKSALAGFLILLLAILLNNNLFAQEELPAEQSNLPAGQASWYINTNLQLAGGNFIYNSFDNIVSLYGGISYQNNNFGILFSIPVVGNKNNFISQAGGMMLPIGNSKNNTGSMQGGSNSGVM